MVQEVLQRRWDEVKMGSVEAGHWRLTMTSWEDAEAEAPILWSLDEKNWLIGKDPDAWKDWGQEEKGTTEDEMAGWHHWLNGHESEQALGLGDGQGGLGCCSPWGHKELVMTERLNWTDWPVQLPHAALKQSLWLRYSALLGWTRPPCPGGNESQPYQECHGLCRNIYCRGGVIMQSKWRWRNTYFMSTVFNSTI